MRVYAWACIRVLLVFVRVLCVYSLCVYVRAFVNTPPLFTAAIDAVYVVHLFPRLLSLKSIVFSCFLVCCYVVVGVQILAFSLVTQAACFRVLLI